MAEGYRRKVEELEKQLAINDATKMEMMEKEVAELKQQHSDNRKQHKEELVSVRNSIALFRQWTEVFQQGCATQMSRMVGRVTEVQAENEFLHA